jgi:glucose-6-phosphate 1-dehydrogenase
LVLFGASGDLAERKPLPTLFRLWQRGHLSERFYILGVARTALDDEGFRWQVGAALQALLSEPVARGRVPDFLKCLHYQMLAYDEAAGYRRLGERTADLDRHRDTHGNRLFYLALPSWTVRLTAANLGSVDHTMGDGRCAMRASTALEWRSRSASGHATRAPGPAAPAS